MPRKLQLDDSAGRDAVREPETLAEAGGPAEAANLRREVARQALRKQMFGVDEAPVQVGRYRMLEPLGSGAMGIVYLAEDPELGRKLAIKLVRADEVGSEGRARFLREARALAMLNHSNVVTIHDVGEHEEQAFIAMEYVPGRTLGKWIEDEQPGVDAVIDAYRAAGRGVAAAHRAGLIHRDFKPANVIVADNGRIVVVDFGLARLVDEVEPPESTADEPDAEESDPLALRLTQTGARLGTPAYMSPEQLSGQAADARSDQFSFCAALYEGVYGKRPYRGENLGELLASASAGNLERPDPTVDVPAGVWNALARGLRPDASGRFPSMDDLLAEIDEARRPPVKRRTPPLAFVAAFVAVGGVTVGLMQPGDDVDVPLAPRGAPDVQPPPPEKSKAPNPNTAALQDFFDRAQRMSNDGKHSSAVTLMEQILSELPAGTDQDRERGDVLLNIAVLHDRISDASGQRKDLESAHAAYERVLLDDAVAAFDEQTVASAEDGALSVAAKLDSVAERKNKRRGAKRDERKLEEEPSRTPRPVDARPKRRVQPIPAEGPLKDPFRKPEG